MTIGTRLFTWWRGELAGTDAYGNRYYREKNRGAIVKGGGIDSRERRWVMFQGAAEASKVPPEWHGWLHHTSDEVPHETVRQALAEAASAEPDRYIARISSAGFGPAGRASPACDRRLRALDTLRQIPA